VAAVLADRLMLAMVEHGPTSGSRLARLVHVRKCDALAELRTNSRFAKVGRGRGSRWRPAGWHPRGTGQEPQGREARPDRGKTAGVGDRERLEALERRVAELEGLAGTEARANGDGVLIPGQTTVYEMLGEEPAA
jgi:hypothetical protein